MARWRVQSDHGVQELTDEKLRRLLRSGQLTGTMLARREDEAEWKPLARHDVFREEVPFDGSPVVVAAGQALGPLLVHAAVFVSIGTFVADWAWWMAFWGIGLASHAAGAARALVRLRPAPPRSGAEARPAAVGVPADPLHAELSRALDALASAAKGRDDIDVAGTRRAAEALMQRRTSILPLCDPATRARLEAEQQAIIGEEEKAPAELKEVLRGQALALQQRLDAMDEAGRIAAALEAKIRTVLHQVENLRLQLARAGAYEDDSAPSLAEDVARLKREIAADAETEAAAKGRPLGPNRQPT